jgi:Protein of unknown function (DUF669)
MGEILTSLDVPFDTDTEEGTPALTVIPPGRYTAEITKATVGALRSGKGQAVELVWEVKDGQYEGRMIFDRVIITHVSEDAMKFGRQKFKDICIATGVSGQVTDLSVLEGKPCSVWVKIEEDANGQYEPKNRIGRVKPVVSVGAPAKGNGTELNDSIPF